MFTARNAVKEVGARYKRHQPKLTLLYQIVETYYPEILDYMENQGKTLPTRVKRNRCLFYNAAVELPII